MASKINKIPGKGQRKPFSNACEEKFVCTGLEAIYFCQDCQTRQCSDCENKLHGSPKYVFHDRRKIADGLKLCEFNFCGKPGATATIYCINCESYSCDNCSKKIHARSKMKNHERQPLLLNPSNDEAATAPSPGQTSFESANEETFESFASISLPSLGKPPEFSLPKQSTSEPIVNAEEVHSPLETSPPPMMLKSTEALSESSSPVSTTVSRPVLIKPAAGAGPGRVVAATDELSSLVAYNDSLAGDGGGGSGSGIQGQQWPENNTKGFLFIDENEILQVNGEDDLAERLGCPPGALVKVLSIFGNTGDGKSHTLNHIFFGGHRTFPTSTSQQSCTIGVWAAYEPHSNLLLLDTEGLLGITSNQNQRMRLLLKVLAISDVVVYLSRAERLHSDLFRFLGDASAAYLSHFTKELKLAVQKYKLDVPLSTLGPAVVIFHETRHTDLLGSENNAQSKPAKQLANQLLQERFKELGYSVDAFSSMEYVGTQTGQAAATDFSQLKTSVHKHIINSSVRSPRSPAVVFQTLKVLNEKFSGNIDKEISNTFPDEYFTCPERCLSCGLRCRNSMNHTKDNLPHDPKKNCKFQSQFDNRVYICRNCNLNGMVNLVTPKASASTNNSWVFGLAKFAWSGYVLECPKCGIIYRSRQYWYGNKDPINTTAVMPQIRHVWLDGAKVLQTNHNAARRLLDGITQVADTVSTVSATPKKLLSDWVADQIAPSYWKPNSDIKECNNCKSLFTTGDEKHHCRACGEGFCDNCSSKKRHVPERGWGQSPVRVCDACFNKVPQQGKLGGEENSEELPEPVIARKVGEVVQSTLGVVASAMEYPKGFVLESARPSYWKSDQEITDCHCCKEKFGGRVYKHHCRCCGEGVCNDCSQAKRPVPSRGWDNPVRVCNICNKNKEDL